MDLSSIIDVSWHQVEQLTRAGIAPKPIALFESGPCGVSTNGDFAVVVQEEGRDVVHLCGPKCIHLLLDDSGGYVCRLTGMSFGQQLCNGPTDARLCDVAMTPTPSDGKKRRRAHTWNTSTEEIFSACNQMVKKLLLNTQRKTSDNERLVKALKSAVRLASVDCAKFPCVLQLMFASFAEVERCGALVVKREVTLAQIDSITVLLVELFHTIIAPYLVIDRRRPTSAYYGAAMCYQLATGNLGSKLHVPLLSVALPEEKSLKTLGIIVSRVTTAKRYILAAIKHHIDSHIKIKMN
jgi:hypothetical protein